MLSSLKIENVAVIEHSEILFDAGLNILTGETGAGKSIVIDSINAILGERTSREIIRAGADKAKVTAFFENVPKEIILKLEEFDVDCEDDRSVLITRIITSDGRSTCKINGRSVTASMLKSVGRELITICGQHDSQHLLNEEHHIDFIDAMTDCAELKADYLETFEELKALKKHLKKLINDEDDKERRIEFLKYQIEEINSANLCIGEKERLLEEKKKIQNREKIITALNTASQLITGNEGNVGISDGIYRLTECLEELSDCDKKYQRYIEFFEEAKCFIDECSSEISSDLSYSEEGYTDIDSIEERLDTLYRLSRKYGETEEDMLSYLEKITREYNEIISSDELIEELSERFDELSDELFRKGCHLSDARKETAIEFEKKVMQELRYLDIPNAQFVVEFGEAKATENGIDDVRFLFSANAGQELKSLAKIASGGELSRVMLAIRCVLSDKDIVSSMIFDEIDTGVSGRAAHKIAYKMHELSKNKQVICVTHLAQIAAYADNHLFIEKISDNENTYTKVTSLSENDRVREIARIIGGEIITQTTLNSAKELIEYAKSDN